MKKKDVDGNESCVLLRSRGRSLLCSFSLSNIRDWWKKFFPTLQDFGYHKTIMDMALHLKGVGGTEHMAKFFALAWGLWGRRNKFIYEKILIDKVMIVKELYQDFSNSSGPSIKQKCSC